MRKILFILIGFFAVHSLYADPPEPPIGKRWILNEIFSDEFNGTSLDLTKWYDYHPNWNGRVPGIFLPSQVSVGNGYMTIRGQKLPEDTVVSYESGRRDTFNIACGAVVSRTTDAYFGYYECRFKAAKTAMSTTFWLSTRGSSDGPQNCGDAYGLELDFQECIGREGDFDGSFFAKGMHSNSHFWYGDCEGEKHDYRAPQVLFESEELCSDSFNTYGGWWHDESRVSYYFNNGEPKSQNFYSEVKQKPFDTSMGLNLVSETYPFPWIELPNEKELADTIKNICYYDWVRAYILVDVDSGVPPLLADPVMFENKVSFCEDPDKMEAEAPFSFLVSYEAKADHELFLELFDDKNMLLVEAVYPALGGYGRKYIVLPDESKFAKGENYTARLHLRPKDSIDKGNAHHTDELKFTVTK